MTRRASRRPRRPAALLVRAAAKTLRRTRELLTRAWSAAKHAALAFLRPRPLRRFADADRRFFLLHGLRALIGLSLAAAACLALVYLLPLPERLLIPPSTVIAYADGEPAHVFLSADDKWRLPVSAHDIDPRYLAALIRFEDRRFFQHKGVDFWALGRAVFSNLQGGRIVSGASTLTMQLVRMLEPRPRTIFSKFIELLRVAQIEARLPKAAVLDAYLRHLPFGRNIEGVESAAYAFFGHSARSLSPLEIAYLLAVPRNPRAFFPHPDNEAAALAEARSVAARLRALLIFTDTDLTRFSLERPPIALHPFPREVPHAALVLKNAAGTGGAVRSTLDPGLQRLAERILGSFRTDLAVNGIHNAAVVVLDNETSEARVLAGNFDFWDAANGGQVNGFLAPRSPGSALKPFLFALGIDRGLLIPDQLLTDIPVHYPGYHPRNYDGSFAGLVTARDALAASLNIPFIELTREIGVEGLIQFFREAGVKSVTDDPDRYGLSMTVGGMELTLLELTNLYAMLSRGGLYKPCRLQIDEGPGEKTDEKGRRLLSPGACHLTRETLRLRERPDFPRHREVAAYSPRIYWKTGTSQGRRDAWCLGGNDRYTVGIWVGNFDAVSSPFLMGTEAAAPILFALLSAATARDAAHETEDYPPRDLVEIDVCAFSGRLPQPFCPETRRAWVLKSRVPRQACSFHVRLAVDRKTGYQLPPLVRAGRAYTEIVFLVLPPEVRRWIQDNHLKAQEPPPLPPDYAHAVVQERPRIILPQAGSVFCIVPFLKASQQEIPLEAGAAGLEAELSWFVNGEFLATVPASERLWLKPSPGRHVIRVLSRSGEYDEVAIEVTGGLGW